MQARKIIIRIKQKQMFRKFNYKRFIKYGIVGSASFFLDLVVLNVLSLFTGHSKGIFAAGFSVVSFLVANVNSYLLNKKWTFKENNLNAKYKTFLKISAIGVIVNILIVYFLTTHISQNFVSDLAWLNVSKILATMLVAVFNYIGYKKFVFI
jgi:putative flippase GtrA